MHYLLQANPTDMSKTEQAQRLGAASFSSSSKRFFFGHGQIVPKLLDLFVRVVCRDLCRLPALARSAEAATKFQWQVVRAAGTVVIRYRGAASSKSE